MTAWWVVPVQQWRALDGFMLKSCWDLTWQGSLLEFDYLRWSTHTHTRCSFTPNVLIQRVQTAYVCVFVCELSGASPSHFLAMYWFIHKEAFCWGMLTQKQLSALLSKLWSGVRLPNAIGRKGLWSAPWLAVCGGYFDSAGCVTRRQLLKQQ